MRDQDDGDATLSWIYSPDGPRMSAEVGDHDECASLPAIGYAGRDINLTSTCGRTVVAFIKASIGKPDIAERMTVASADQALAIQILTETKADILRVLAEVRAAETERAGKTGDRPSL